MARQVLFQNNFKRQKKGYISSRSRWHRMWSPNAVQIFEQRLAIDENNLEFQLYHLFMTPLSLVLVPPQDIGPLISAPIGLGRPVRFSVVKSSVDSNIGPWFKLSGFAKLGLNSNGRLATRENHKVFLKPFHPPPCSFQ